MFRVLLLLLAVAGLNARPLHRLPNGRLKQTDQTLVQHEHSHNSEVQKDTSTGVKFRKQIPVPAEFCRQGTEPSRGFLMDLNTGKVNRRVSGLGEFRQGTEEQLNVLRSRASETHQQRDVPPAAVYRQGTEPSRNILMDVNTGVLKEPRLAGSKWEVVSDHEDMKSHASELKENHIAAPVESRRQGTEPSRRFLIDLNTGTLKEEVSEMNRRVSGFYNPVATERRQATEPSRRFLMDLNTGMLTQEVGEMNRRVSGFYNPPAPEVRMGTQNSHATLVDPRTGQTLPTLREMQRSTAPLDEFKQGTEYQPHVLQELRLNTMRRQPSRNLLMDLNTGLLKEHRAKWEVVSEHKHMNSHASELKENHIAAPVESRRQGTEPSRRFLIDLNTGTLKEEVSEMNRRVSGFYNPVAPERRQGTEPSRRFLMDLNTGMLTQEVGEMNRRVSGFYNPPAPEVRMGTQNSHATLVDPRTGQTLPTLREMQRSTAPLDEFKQGTEYQPHVLQELRLNTMRRQGTEPSRAKWEVVSEHKHMNSHASELKENHIAAPVESRRQGTEPSRRFLIDLNTGMLKEEVSEMNRRVSGFYNPVAPERRQGTEPSRRFLMDLNTGMLTQEVGEMNRRVSGFYNPPAPEVRMGTQNSHATLVDPRTGQTLPTLTELQRSTAPLDEFKQGTEYQPHVLQELRLNTMRRQGTEPSRAKWEVVSEHKDMKSHASELKENHIAAPVESRRQGTEPSRRFLIDLNTGMLKEEVSEMNRRVSGFYNPVAPERRQGTEPSRRFLMDLNTGMLTQEVGEMNRRISGFYNPPAPEVRMGTQNSHATLVDPRTGQTLPTLREMQRSTAPLDEFKQGTEYQPHVLQELRLNTIMRLHQKIW